MRLGIGSYAYAWAIGVPGYPPPPRPMRVVDLLDRAATLGVRVVQIADNMPLDRLTDAELDGLLRQADAQDIDLEVGTRGIRLDHLQTYLDLAVRLRSPILRVVVDTAEDQPEADEVVDRVKAIIRAFEEADVCLAIENHDRFEAKALAGICEQVGSTHVGVCLDTVNSFGALEGPEAVVDTLGPWVVTLHVKEFAVRRADHLMGFLTEGRPAGQGHLNLPWLLERLKALGRDVNAILELWPPPEATVAETVAKEAAWAEESVAYLRRFISD